MPSKRAKKVYPKPIPNASFDSSLVYQSLSSPSLPPIDEPLIDEPTIDEPTIDEPIIDEPTIDKPTTNKPIPQEKSAQIKWTIEMIKALVECIYRVWKDGQAADNGFKKEA
jgi:hypothetical protein